MAEKLSKDRRHSCPPVMTTPQSRTIYVYAEPMKSTNKDTIKNMFLVFGDIEKISLPKYKTSEDFKGFAIVEFSTQEAATNAIECFRLKASKEFERRKNRRSPDEKLEATYTAVDGEQSGTQTEDVASKDRALSPSDDGREGDRGTKKGGRKRVRESDEDTEDGDKKRVRKSGDITDEGDITSASIQQLKKLEEVGGAEGAIILKYLKVIKADHEYEWPSKQNTQKLQKPDLIKDPIHGSIELHPLLFWITRTPAFQRLKNIKQMNALHYIYPGATHTRFEHSIGVCYLAGEFARMLIRKLRKEQRQRVEKKYIEEWYEEDKKDETDILCIEIAGLCHDLGHGPFSHLFDEILKEDYKDIDRHEQRSLKIFEDLIYGQDPNEFEKYGIFSYHIPMIKNMIDRSKEFKADKPKNLFLYEIVASKDTGIDVDKWDYFIRDCHYMGLQHEFDYRRLMQLGCIKLVKGIGKRRICYHKKEMNNILGMFRTRCSLYLKGCYHKNGLAAKHKLKKAIKEVAAVKIIRVTDPTGVIAEQTTSIKEIIANFKKKPKDYLALDDGIIHVILNEKPEGGKIEKAQKLLKELNDYDKLAIAHRLAPDEVSMTLHTVLAGAFTDSKRDQEKVEQISFEVNGTGKKLLKIIEKERAKMIDRGVLNKVKETKNFTKLVAEKVKVIAEKERCTEVVTEKVRCTEDDFYFEEVKFGYGSEDASNPLHEVYFYDDDQRKEPRCLEESEYEESLHLFTPEIYELKVIWWYTTLDKSKDDIVIRAIGEVLKEIIYVD